jgi:hypothetical protein
MIAKKVFETLDFERGQDPKEAMRLGKHRHSNLRKAILTGSVDFPDQFEDWLNENPLIKEKLDYRKKDKYGMTITYYVIELDNYCEDRNVDREDLESEYVPQFSFSPVKPGECRVTIGTIADGSKVMYYQGGNIDGFITRKDWLR